MSGISPITSSTSTEASTPITEAPPNKLQKILSETWKVLQDAWATLRNPIDPDWRKNQKYLHVLDGIWEGLDDIIHNENEAPDTPVYSKEVQKEVDDWLKEVGAHQGKPLRRPAPHLFEENTECQFYIKKALQYLADPRAPFKNQRERYKACLKYCEKAMATDYYQSLVKNKSAAELREIETSNPEVAFLHAFCLAQFTAVNVQGFTESLAEGMAKEGGYRPPTALSKDGNKPEDLFRLFKTATGQIPNFTKAIEKASTFHKVGPLTNLGTELQASQKYTRFYPLKNDGNPVYVKYSMKISGRVMTCIRSPTVTVGMNRISPLFKGYLRALKSRELKHTYINLQNRLPPSQIAGARKVYNYLGFIREDLRTKTLERLNQDPEFKGVVSVYTMDKDSDFYMQRPKIKIAQQLLESLKEYITKDYAAHLEKQLASHESETAAVDELLKLAAALKMQPPSGLIRNRDGFVTEFKQRLWDLKGSFHLPREHKDKIEVIVDAVSENFFADKEDLTPSERQDLIEISYEFISDFLLQISGARFFNTSCKEHADRGSTTAEEKLGTKLHTEILTNPDRKNLARDVRQLVTRMNEDALWARKRGVNERMWRSVQALKRIGDFAAENPEKFLALVAQANGSTDVEVMQESKKGQKVENFEKDYKRVRKALGIVSELKETKAALRQLRSKLDETAAAA